jgi:hypothetical protein
MTIPSDTVEYLLCDAKSSKAFELGDNDVGRESPRCKRLVARCLL